MEVGSDRLGTDWTHRRDFLLQKISGCGKNDCRKKPKGWVLRADIVTVGTAYWSIKDRYSAMVDK
eukprot:8694592-Ditylum_brightwellii.AAC.1